MNRRNFFKTLTGAVAGFAILPPATTYGRVWKAMRPPFDLDPFYEFQRQFFCVVQPGVEYFCLTDRDTKAKLEAAFKRYYAFMYPPQTP